MTKEMLVLRAHPEGMVRMALRLVRIQFIYKSLFNISIIVRKGAQGPAGPPGQPGEDGDKVGIYLCLVLFKGFK